MAECLFCAIVAGESPAEVVDADEHTVSFMDINPATPGHALIVPRRHSRDLHEIDPEDLRHTAAAAQRLTKRIAAILEPDGFNLLNACGAAAWQTVYHFHLHVIPRYENDPLKLPWIPRGADPKRIAELAARIRVDG